MNQFCRLGRASERNAGDASGRRRFARRRSRRRPATNATHPSGTPASNSNSIARVAINGVCSAGFASTALPAASAAAIWPVKMANGKFQGLMQQNTPRPCSFSSLLSPVGPGRRTPAPNSWRRAIGVVAQEVDRLAHFGNAVWNRAAALAHAISNQFRQVLFVEIRGLLQNFSAFTGRRRIPLQLRRHGGRNRFIHERRIGMAHHANDFIAIGRIAHFDAVAVVQFAAARSGPRPNAAA